MTKWINYTLNIGVFATLTPVVAMGLTGFVSGPFAFALAPMAVFALLVLIHEKGNTTIGGKK